MLNLKVKRVFAILVLLGLVFVSSCQDEEIDSTINPSNLVVDVIISEDNSGNVEVAAVADNAVGHEFYSGDNITQEPLYKTSGIFSYKYTNTGIYLIQIRAYGSSGKYLLKEIQITVQVGEDPPGPIDPEEGYKTPLSYPGMNLVWQDEFSGNILNTADWTHEIGTGNNGWGNNELQYYRSQNSTVMNGYLTIEARKESYGGRSYTSSRIITKNKQEFKYGRIDIRAVLPKGQGLWPALWMLGANIDQVGWPKCGELDIMELIGGSTGDNRSYGTIHWDNDGQKADYGLSYTLPSGIFNDKFHVFTTIWDNTSITWFVDDIQFATADITPAALSEFHQDAFFVFNVAVGGNWPGSPDASTVFPQQMIVDYVRVFQDM